MWIGQSDTLMIRTGSAGCEVTATENHKDWGRGGAHWRLCWGLNSEACSKNLTTRSSFFSYNEMSRRSAGSSQEPGFLGELLHQYFVALILMVLRMAALQSRQHRHFPEQRKKASASGVYFISGRETFPEISPYVLPTQTRFYDPS